MDPILINKDTKYSNEQVYKSYDRCNRGKIIK